MVIIKFPDTFEDDNRENRRYDQAEHDQDRQGLCLANG